MAEQERNTGDSDRFTRVKNALRGVTGVVTALTTLVVALGVLWAAFPTTFTDWFSSKTVCNQATMNWEEYRECEKQE